MADTPKKKQNEEVPFTPQHQVRPATNELTKEEKEQQEQDKKLEQVRLLRPQVFRSFVSACASFAIFTTALITAISIVATNPGVLASLASMGSLEIAVIAITALLVAALISGIISSVVCNNRYKQFKSARLNVNHRLAAEGLAGSPFKISPLLTAGEKASAIVLAATKKSENHYEGNGKTLFADDDSEASPSRPQSLKSLADDANDQEEDHASNYGSPTSPGSWGDGT